jgi:multidrug efflux pump subunit AcrA (membrane-fusion protein)
MKRGAIKGFVVPASALMRSARQPAVWVVDPNASTVSLRSIEMAEFERDGVVVVSGLNGGDVVVTAGVQELRPGQKVRLLRGEP